ncbi:MAG: efflux RND transporter permease subunit, partial [Marinifilaceae bacterium]
SHTFVSVGWAFQGTERGTHAGNIFVLPRNLDDIEITGMEIAALVKKKIGAVPEARKFTVGGTNRWGAPVSISLMSRNLNVLEDSKEYLIKELGKIPVLKDIVDNNAQGKQEILLKLKDEAYFLGLTEASLASQIRFGFYGGQVQRLQEGRDELRVWIRYPKEGRQNIGQLENMKIKTAMGEYPLSELIEYSVKRGPVSIKRLNGKREGRIEAELLDPYASVTEILAQVKEEIIPLLKAKYPSVDVAYQGQQKTSNEAMEQIKIYYSLAFALIIAVLMMHFRSVSQAVIILLMIPLSFLGVMWGHGIHMRPVSLMSVWGIVALSGVVINDAVVFLAKFNLLMENGGKLRESIIEAGKTRLRPIILTSVTTSVGLFPMILEKSPQAQFLIPTALSLAYGIVFGTFFILIFFPVFIHVLNDIKVYTAYLWTGKKPSREEVCIAVINKKRENMDE